METRELKVIGKGLFTTCYALNTKEVLLRSSDPIKECMSLGWFPGSRLFPKVERIDQNLYKMHRYEKVASLKTSLTPKDYALYQELRGLKVGGVENTYCLNIAWHSAFDTIKDRHVRESMKEALDACCDYGSDISFEISPRNVAVKNGKLILLDCFFVRSYADTIRTSKRSR